MKKAPHITSTLLIISMVCVNLTGQQSNVNNCEKDRGIEPGAQVPEGLSQETVADVARCLVTHQDNFRASQWYASIADNKDCKPEFILEYGQCLKSLELYGKAKFYFQKYAEHDPVVGYQMMQSCDIARLVIEGQGIFDVARLKSSTPNTDLAPFITGEKLQFCSIDNTRPVHHSVYLSNVLDSYAKVNNGTSPGVYVRVSENGSSLVYCDAGFNSGERIISPSRNGKVYYSEKNVDGEWSEATEIHFPESPNIAFPTLSPDGKTLYFSSDMSGGYGGMDLYKSNRAGNNWSAPVNLGANVNTVGNEISPFATETELFFSSDMHVGLGGFDIFRTQLSVDFSKDVAPVGYPVNSSKDDIDFIWDSGSNTCYFASNRTGGPGSYDIYRAIPQFTEKVITVMDKENMKPVTDAMLVIKPGITRATYTNMYGEATVRHNFTSSSEIIVQKEGFAEYRIAHVSEGPAKVDVYLEPVAEPVAEVKTVPEPPKEVRQAPKPIAVNTPAPKKEEPEDEETIRAREILKVEKPAVKERKTELVNKYFIQIAALAINSDLTSYSDLRMYGDLVVHDDDKYSRVRVGTFDSEEQARTALARVKAGGYPDAFVVMQAVISNPSGSTTQSAEYKVRLGTYSNTGNFDPTPIEHLGSIEAYRKDEYTIMLLSGFSSLSDAKKAREEVTHYGYKDAYVVMANDGALEKVKD